MKNNELVSVIVPVFNASQTIKNTLESVLTQTYKDLELIVIDDSSTDDTGSIISEIQSRDSRVVFQKLTRNSGGPATPRNVGLNLSRGKYIAFLDADDVWHEEHLQRSVNGLQKGGWFVSSNMIKFYDENDKTLTNMRQNPVVSSCFSRKISFNDLLVKNIIPNSSVVIDGKYLKGETFSTCASHIAVEDFLLWLHLHKLHGPSMQFFAPSIAYRKSPTSISSNKLRMTLKRFGALRSYGLSRMVSLWYVIKFIFASIIPKK